MGNLDRTPTKGSSKSTSKFLPVFDLLTVSSLSNFDNLNSNKLMELFRELQRIDPKTANFDGKVTEKNHKELWKNVFDTSSNFNESHRLFKETIIQPRNLVPKNSYNDSKFLARPVVSKNAVEIVSKFKKPDAKEPEKYQFEAENDESLSEKTEPIRVNTSTSENLDSWFEEMQKSQISYMQSNFKNLKNQIFKKLEDNTEKIETNSEKIKNLEGKIDSGSKDLEKMSKDVTTLKNDKADLEEKLQILQNQFNQVLEFKENCSFANEQPKLPVNLDDFTRVAWYQQFLISTRKFTNATLQAENLGFIQVDNQREYTDQLIYKEQNSNIPKLDINRFRTQTGVDIDVQKVWQKPSMKYAALVRIKAPFTRRAQITRELIDRRARYKGKFGLSLSLPNELKIDNFLQFLTRWIDPETNEAVITGYDKTKRGFLFVYLNDVTNEMRDDFYRNHDREARDGELSTRVFIPCPIEFSKLTQEALNIENLKKLGAKTHFCFNGGIWERPRPANHE